MNRSLVPTALISLALAAAAACGGAAAPAPPPGSLAPAADSARAAPSPTASVGPAEAAALEAWRDDMSKDQKVAFMKKNVVPRMRNVFDDQGGRRSGSFGCQTCHGSAFKDPQDFLPRLTMRGGKITAFEEKPQVAKFMAEQVVPQMAAAMGMKPYDPATHQGFGCGGCHAVDAK
jgi:hypothetical protein